MEMVADAELRPGRFKKSVVTIGNFDGVHVGHQALIREVCRRANVLGGPSVVYTFDPHPLRVLDPSICPAALTDFDQKAELVAALGVDAMIRVRFDREYAGRPPVWFAREVLGEHLGAAEVWVGPDFAFGCRRCGDVSLLQAEGAKVNYTVHSFPPVLAAGVRVSSTRVREAVRRQDFREARMLLGRPYALHGPVVSGERRGRGLGFPTANLLPREECLPPPGVYAARAEVDGRRYLAAVNVGTNPTFSSDAPARTTVEAHLLDFSGDLYARTMRLEFVCPIRGEIAFASPDALVAQIGRDVEAVRQVLARGEAG